MKCTAILFATLIVASNVFSEDPGEDRRSRKESEDPSYEPMRGSARASKPKTEKAPDPAPDPVVNSTKTSKQKPAAPQAEVIESSGPQVKYIIDGKPIYEGDPRIAEIEGKKSASSSKKKEKEPAPSKNSDKKIEVQAASTGPQVKYIIDGQPIYEGDPRIAEIEGKKSASSGKKKASDISNGATASVGPIINYHSDAPADIQAPSGPRVKYIVNGKPIYEGDPMIAEIEHPKSSTEAPSRIETESAPSKGFFSWFKKSSDSKSVVASTEPAAPAASETPSESGPRVKYILDGKPVYEGDAPAPAVVVQSGTYTPAPVFNDAQPTSRQPVALVDDDLTADKPGTPGAAGRDLVLLEEYPPGEHLNTRAKKCYALLAALKTNVETVSRCLDNRGKENARLVHTSDEMGKNITDLADIWPASEEYIDRCTSTKRYALLFSEELGRSPWHWAQVRWTFDRFLKDVRGFREYAKVIADLELKQVPKKDKNGAIVRLKNGDIIWEDVPDPEIDQLAAKKQADRKAKDAELARLRRSSEIHSEYEKNKPMDVDLRNAR